MERRWIDPSSAEHSLMKFPQMFSFLRRRKEYAKQDGNDFNNNFTIQLRTVVKSGIKLNVIYMLTL